MKRNNQNNPQNAGYPQQNGYGDPWQGGMPYQGYPARQGYQAPQGYPQQGYSQPQGYPQQQGYPQPQNFAQPQGYPQAQGYMQPQGYQSARNYQTPQVTSSQPAASAQDAASPMAAPGTIARNGYPSQQGYGQAQAGFQGTNAGQQAGYPRQNPAGVSQGQGYGYSAPQAPAGSYIPQTPYSQGYTSPGYQPTGGYNQVYSAYNQMGKTQQPSYFPQQDMGGQVPLNGGGYVPQPVPVRKQPFVLTDTYLLIVCALLLILFALGMFVPGLSALKWAFVILAAASAAVLWIRPLTANNKRLCYTIVFGLLILVTLMGFITGGTGARQPETPPSQTEPSGQSGYGGEQNNGGVPAQNAQPTPSVTYTPEPDQNKEVTDRVDLFFNYWESNNQDGMLSLCSPSWASKQDNPKAALFGLMANRTPKDHDLENISGTPNDTTRTVTLTSNMDRNNGKPVVRYRLGIIMVKENDGYWYVDPNSLQTYEDADTPDPSITSTPVPTEEPATYDSTILYYNPSGGEFYHRDQNCKRINERYLPLQGHFTYAELNSDDKYKKLKPCVICGAPSRQK